MWRVFLAEGKLTEAEAKRQLEEENMADEAAAAAALALQGQPSGGDSPQGSGDGGAGGAGPLGPTRGTRRRRRSRERDRSPDRVVADR